MLRDQVGDGNSLLNLTHTLVRIVFYRQVASLPGVGDVQLNQTVVDAEKISA